MEVVNSPNPVDEPSLIYKLQRKLRVFEESNFPNRGYNLVATSSKYGLVFVGLPTPGFSVYHLREVTQVECARPSRAALRLPEPPSYLAVSCDRDTLAVCTRHHLHLYRVHGFQNENVTPMSVLINDNGNAYVTSLQWNPCLADTLALALSDGSLFVGQLSGTEFPFKKIPAKARCLCWSPKGKQLVTGNSDGSLTQYKPDLTAVKAVPAPDVCGGRPAEALAVHWVSNYQFAVVYRNALDDSRPCVTIVNTPKAGASVCINYDDVCYSMSKVRPWYYYLLSVPQWGLLLAASSNSVDVATLATTDATNWIQWCQLDEAKPELPLTATKQDSYPVGLAFDTSALHHIPWGENESLPHMPQLLVLSHTGLLVVFNAINLRAGAQQICAEPQQLTLPRALLVADPPEGAEQPPPPPPTAASAAAPPPAAPLPPAPVPPLAAPVASMAQVGQNLQAGRADVFAQAPPSYPASQPASVSFGQVQPTAYAPQNQVKPSPEVTSQPPQKPTPTVQTAPVAPSQPAEPSQPAKSAQSQMKASEELQAAEAKANEEMRAMLVKEVNNFQGEVYKFVQTHSTDVKLDMSSVSELSEKLKLLNAAQIEKDCSMESLNAAIVELKLDIVKTFAQLAEARSNPGSEEESGRRVEPLCARTVESVRRRACRLQSQLETAERIVHHKWGEVYARSQLTNKPGERMARPALDAVYQPLVRQQQILNRQRAVLRTLQAALGDASAHQRNNIIRTFSKDPLSKLTKNILNMSMESKESGGGCAGAGLTPHKLEALRDLLTNRKTIRIKPVNMEIERHLASMQDTHDRLLQEMRELRVKTEHIAKDIKLENTEPVARSDAPVAKTAPKDPQPPPKPAPVTLKPAPTVQQPIQKPPKEQPKPQQQQQQQQQAKLAAPQAVIMEGPPVYNQPNVLNWAQHLKPAEANGGKSVTITASNIASVARNLFTNDESKPEPKPAPPAAKPSAPDKSVPTSNANSVLIGLLQSKSSQQTSKADDGTFLGQKICSPAAASGGTMFGATPFSPATYKPTFSTTGATNPTFSGPSFFAATDSKPFAFSQPKSPEIAANGQKSTDKTISDTNSAETGEENEENAKKKEPVIPAGKNGETKDKQSLFGNNFNPDKPDVKSSEIENKMASIFGEQASIDIPKSVHEIKSKSEEKPNATPAQTPSITNDKVNTEMGKAFSFMGSAQASPKVPMSTGSIFAMPSSPNANSGSIFSGSAAPEPSKESPAPTPSAPTSAGSIFASAPAASGASTATSVFANAASSSPPALPAAAVPAVTSPAAGSIFAGASAAAAAAVAAASVGAVDGGTAKPSLLVSPLPVAAPASPAAAPAPAAPSSGSLFAPAPAAVPTTATSIFASPSPVNSGSIFGSPATAAAPIFGVPSPAAVAPNVFGSAATSPASIFGAPTAQSVFGSPTAQPQQSVFGSPATTAPPSGSVFGSPATTAPPSGSVFGSPATTAASAGSMFGASEATSLFGAASIGGGTSPAQPAANVFAGSGSGGSVFGGGGAGVFGSKPAFGQSSPSSIFSGSSAFGQQAPAAGIFGSSATFGSSFASPQTTQSSSIFGGGGGFGTSGGQQSAFGTASPAAQTSMFGATEAPKPSGSVFGSPQQTASAFGGGSVFGSKPVFGQTTGFGSSAFSGFSGGSNVAQSGFGAPAAFGNKSPGGGGGFGGAPVFGGSPSFGSGAFGSSSPTKMFGGASPGFGAPMQQSSTFENLASQNTVSFGNLAQQSPQQTHQPPAFNTSPSFSGWRG